jgi:exopolysaccharide production protein ExoY
LPFFAEKGRSAGVWVVTELSVDSVPAPYGVSLGGRLANRLWLGGNQLLALTILILTAPLLAAIAVAIFAQDRGPILFGHSRIGQGGRVFSCLKFRSMCVDAEDRLAELLAADEQARLAWDLDHKLKADPRVTRLGGFLRRSSLDEFPQLLNVLRGDMNIVGPRPIVAAEIPRYGRRFASYAAVKPGITGLWQVSGRNDVSYRARVAMDHLYARRRTPALDLWILVKTIPAVLARKGSY